MHTLIWIQIADSFVQIFHKKIRGTLILSRILVHLLDFRLVCQSQTKAKNVALTLDLKNLLMWCPWKFSSKNNVFVEFPLREKFYKLHRKGWPATLFRKEFYNLYSRVKIEIFCFDQYPKTESVQIFAHRLNSMAMQRLNLICRLIRGK